jgi:hypothetical protein
MPENQRIVGPAQRVEHQRGFGDFYRGNSHINRSPLAPSSS